MLKFKFTSINKNAAVTFNFKMALQYSRSLCSIFTIFLAISNILTKEIFTETIDDLSAVVQKYDNVTLRMFIKWNSKLRNTTQLDISVTPIEKDCYGKPCLEYGIKHDIREFFFPQHPDEIIENIECSILPGCSYNVEVTTYSAKKNITVRLPDCIEGICSCKHEKFLPETYISANILSANSINVSWILQPRKIFRQFVPIPTITLESIYISVAQLHNPTLTWGGTNNPIQSHRYYINSTGYNVSKTLRKSTKFDTPIPLVPGSHYRIRGFAIDKKGCQGPEGIFVLKVPVTKSSQASRWSLLQVISGLVFIILAVLALVFLGSYIHKKIHRKKTTAEMTVIHSISSAGNNTISMEENPLYLDKDNFEIPHSCLIIGEEIGKGAFGRVFKASAHLLRAPGSTITVAVKQLKKSPSSDEVEEFLGEIQTMKSVGYHENVVTLLGCCTIKEPLMMVMEYVGNGDLLQYLRVIRKKHLQSVGQVSNGNVSVFNGVLNTQTRHTPPIQGKYLELKLSASSTASDKSYISQTDVTPATLRPSVTETMYTILSQNSNGFTENSVPTLDYILDNKELHNFALQIAKGMRHLEEKGITHRDLATRNILIDSRKTLKISDFGLSRAGIYVNTKNKKLPLRWLSIEAIRDNFYSNKSDVWAFAIVLWEIGTLGGFPYPTLSNQEILPFLSSGQRLERPEISTESLHKLMLECWEEDSEKRPTFKEILKWLQPQKEKVYIDFNSLGPNYVFPPTRDQVLER